jgi:hypothetical protein
MKKLACIVLMSSFALAALGCPPEGAKKDDHKPGDGHDHSKDEKKK